MLSLSAATLLARLHGAGGTALGSGAAVAPAAVFAYLAWANAALAAGNAVPATATGRSRPSRPRDGSTTGG